MSPHHPDFGANRHPSPHDANGCASIFADNTLPVPWNGWDVVKAALLIAGLAFVFVFAGMLLLRGAPEDAKTIFEEHLSGTMVYCAMLAGVWFFSLRKYGVSWRRLGFRSPAPSHLLLLPPIAIALNWGFGAAYILLIASLGIEALIPEQEAIKEMFGSDTLKLITYFNTVVLAPFIEEILFRGFILVNLTIRLGAVSGALITSALFALAHFDLDMMLPIFVSGMLMAWLYLRTGSLWPPIAMHAVSNGVAVVQFELFN